MVRYESTKRSRVLVAGAINTDLVGTVTRAPTAGETVTGQSFAIFGGGKGANQAVAARRSGAEVSLVGALGEDDFGHQRASELSAEGVDITSVARRNQSPSGVALILVEEGGENRIAYIPGATSTVSVGDLVGAVTRTSPLVYLQPNEVPLAAARAGLVKAGEIGAIRILNAAPDPTDVRSLLEHVDILIANRGEAVDLAELDPVPDDGLLTLAEQLSERYSIDVVITGGAAGAFYWCHGTLLTHVAASEVNVVDTTGAGDTFCGALAAKLAMGAGFREAAEWAVTAATLATTVAGAQPSIPHADAIQATLSTIGE